MKTTVKIYTKPHPKVRPRFYKGVAYNPKSNKDYEALIASSYLSVKGKFFEDRKIKITMLFEFEVPKSYNEKKRSDALSGILRPTKNDLDNLIKAVQDGLNGVAFTDDRYICKLVAEKKFAEKDCVTIVIEEVE